MASGQLGTILVRITADATDFVSSLDQANKGMEAFVIAGAAMVTTGVAIVGTFALAAESTSKYETEIYNMAQRTGIATETLSALSYAAEAQGKTLDSVQVAFRQLAREADNAALGQAKAVEVFRELGVSVNDSSGHLKDLNTLFPQVNEALSKVSDSTQKIALANELYGRTSLALLPVLGSGADALYKWSQSAEAAGVSVSATQAAQGKAFQLMQLDVEKSLQGLALSIGTILLPSMEGLAKTVENGLQGFRQWVQIHPELITLTTNFALALAGAGGLLLGIAAVHAGVTLLNAELGTLGGRLAVIGTILAVGTAVWMTYSDNIKSYMLGASATVQYAIAQMAGSLGDLAGKAGLESLRDSLKTTQFSLEENAIALARQADEFGHVMNAGNSFVASLDRLGRQYQSTSDSSGLLTRQQEQFNNSVKNIVDSVTAEGTKHQELIAALDILSTKQVDNEVVRKKLGTQIEQVVKDLEAEGKVVSGNLLYWDIYIKAHKDAIDIYNQETDYLKKIVKAYDDFDTVVAKIPGQLEKIAETNLKPLTEQWEKHYATLGKLLAGELKDEGDAAQQRIKMINQEITADTDIHQKEKDMRLALLQLQKAADDEANAYHQTVLDYRAAMETGADELTLARLKDLADKEGIEWKAYSDEVVKLQGELATQAAAKFKQVSDATESIFTTMFEDMTFKGKGVFESIQDGIKTGALSLGKILEKDLIDSLTGPITRAFSDFFTSTLEGLAKGWLNQFGKDLATTLSGGQIGSGGGVSGFLANLLGGFLGFLDVGTPYVPHTGMAVLHEGERVMTAAENKLFSSVVNNYGAPGSQQPAAASSSSSGQVENLLAAILDAVSSDRSLNVNIDRTTLVSAIYRASRFGGAQIIGQQ